jgi:isopenicillin N synthase-like dioxygenase
MSIRQDRTAVSVQQEALPVIDVSGLTSPNEATRKAVGEAIRSACLDKGFFYLVGHGIDQQIIDAAFTAARTFFDLPEDAKAALDKSVLGTYNGYDPLRGQVLEPGTAPDLKESFYIGEEVAPDDSRISAGKFGVEPNIWPTDLPDFRAATMTYFEEVLALARRVLKGLALSLDLPEDHFDGFATTPIATLRMIHYPPQSPTPDDPSEKGCGAHTDFGALTFLAQDQVGGLQVWDQDLGWVHAAPIPGSFVVNLGDLIARWTNDTYHSTMHRVINQSGNERYSIPFFFNGNPDFDVQVLPSCLQPGQQPKYQPTTPALHLQECYARTYTTTPA